MKEFLFTTGWVKPKAALYAMANGKLPASASNRTQAFQAVVQYF
jgi:hypothetical protein